MNYRAKKFAGILLAGGLAALTGCTEPVNAPRPLADYAGNTIFSAFSGRSPKTLDPQVSYSNDESFYTYAVYEPLLGYHYLKRPYEIVLRCGTIFATRRTRRLRKMPKAAIGTTGCRTTRRGT